MSSSQQSLPLLAAESGGKAVTPFQAGFKTIHTQTYQATGRLQMPASLCWGPRLTCPCCPALRTR